MVFLRSIIGFLLFLLLVAQARLWFGDGSISAGMAYAAVNNAGAEGRRFVVILIDNEMSIAPPVGAMSKYLSGLYANESLHTLKDIADGFTSVLPSPLREGAKRAKSLVTGFSAGSTFFEEMGFSYSTCFQVWP